MHISEEDRKQAIGVLTSLLQTKELLELLPHGVRVSVEATEGPSSLRLSSDIGELILDLNGTDLLARFEIRNALLLALPHDKLTSLRDLFGVKTGARTQKGLAGALAQRKWYAGRAWARQIVEALGLPSVFSGTRTAVSDLPFEDVLAYQDLPPLYDYQEEASQLILGLLRSAGGRNRGILSLPTGAGKTRTVVEALLRPYIRGDLKGPLILWVAQSEELCEQAVTTFRRVWTCIGPAGESLRIYRVWGAREFPGTSAGGVIVASIQKLYALANRSEESREQLSDLSSDLAAVIIDEAHHATAPSYSDVLSTLDLSSTRGRRSDVPLLGLTATPYRGAGDSGTEELSRRFDGNLLIPRVLDQDPIGLLQRRGILAKTEHRVVETGTEWSMTSIEEDYLRMFGDFSESFIRRIGQDGKRNRIILANLLRLDPTWSVLFFGCSKEHAIVMASLLRRRGVRSASVTSDTSRTERRALVDAFRENRVRVLCNYGIFTTGFDAPNVRAVVVARPTTSAVLYEQMVGRGLRGPMNGGTEEVLVVDIGDNLERFGLPMAHTRFQAYWRAVGHTL